MKCDRCGYDDKGTDDTAHVCGPVNAILHEEYDRFEELMAKDESHLPVSEQSLIFRLRKRAEIDPLRWYQIYASEQGSNPYTGTNLRMICGK